MYSLPKGSPTSPTVDSTHDATSSTSGDDGLTFTFNRLLKMWSIIKYINLGIIITHEVQKKLDFKYLIE